MPLHESLTMYFDSPATMISAPDGGNCGDCHSVHFLFINRDGRTRCADCDWRYQQKRKAEEREFVLLGGFVAPILRLDRHRVRRHLELGLFTASEPEEASDLFMDALV